MKWITSQQLALPLQAKRIAVTPQTGSSAGHGIKILELVIRGKIVTEMQPLSFELDAAGMKELLYPPELEDFGLSPHEKVKEHVSPRCIAGEMPPIPDQLGDLSAEVLPLRERLRLFVRERAKEHAKVFKPTQKPYLGSALHQRKVGPSPGFGDGGGRKIRLCPPGARPVEEEEAQSFKNLLAARGIQPFEAHQGLQHGVGQGK